MYLNTGLLVKQFPLYTMFGQVSISKVEKQFCTLSQAAPCLIKEMQECEILKITKTSGSPLM